MGHYCPECASSCFCGGDIDDLMLDLPEDSNSCCHCPDPDEEEGIEDEPEEDEED